MLLLQVRCYRPVIGILIDMGANEEIVALAKKELARRRGISAERITLKHIEAVDWPDASLGCPGEGKAYAQVIIPGYRLLLSDGTADFEYHTDSHLRAVYCSSDKK
jgi:hypothetical protein